MSSVPNFEKYIEFQLALAKYGGPVPQKKETPRAFVTISRETGAGGLSVSEKLADYLSHQSNKTGNSTCPWTVFSRNIVSQVIAEHDLPKKIAPYLSENKISEIEDALDELFGVHPSKVLLVRKVSETIMHLAQMGNAIILGRGSNLITRKLFGGLHVRLVGSLSNRVRHVSDFYRMDLKKAAAFTRNKDREKRNYIRKYFDQDIQNPLLYDLIINTDYLSYEQSAATIGDTLFRKNLNS